jgi:predicted carbohydrate-binding protein with CBM5 and CBM33 domain
MKKKKLEKRTSKSISFGLKEWKWSNLFCIILLLTIIQSAFPHGTVTSPVSRIYNCWQENPENPESPPCIAAVISHGTQPLYDWNEINQANANGEHELYVFDGNLASGGRPEKYGGMDQITSEWVATPVSPGPFTITWTNTAPHATEYYDVYITKESWTPDQPLTWDSLELLVRTSPSSAASSVDIPVILPVRTGKHVIYSIWQRSDSPEAFYSTSDIDFDGVLSIDDLSTDFNLSHNYPNPFNSKTKIVYRLENDAFVTINVYDVFGKKVSTLVNRNQSSGEHEVTFNGENLSTGVYFYVFQIGSYIEAKRMILQR